MTSDLCLDFPLNLDLLIVVERSTSMADVRRQLDEQLTQQLDLLESSSLTAIKVSDFHFFYSSVASRTIKTMTMITARMMSMTQHQQGHRQPL